MTIFTVHQVNAAGPLGTLRDAVIHQFPSDHYEISSGYWLISADATAKALSDQLGISEGERGTGLVLEVASYFGRANPAIWSWIKTKWEGGRIG